VVNEPEKVRREIGVLFQDITLDRELTGYENLWIHGLIYGIPRSRINEILSFVELSEWSKIQVKKYSGGMQRRLQIAAALLHKPKILFLDEPTLGLDPQTRNHIWDYIFHLQTKEKITIFLTTHYMDEAEKLCNRVAIIDHGKIIALGTPEELKRFLGREIVYIRLAEDNKAGELIASLERKGMFADVHIVGANKISVSVRNAAEAIPEIFEVASTVEVKIQEITYHKPTLNDVFLHLTGKELRDSEASTVEAFRAVFRRR
jgi:ABC-2 type transport system ATP-binding protein